MTGAKGGPIESGRGVFVTFEGVEGCGKSTHVRRLATVLRASGHDVLETREPGGTALGRSLRALLLTPADTPPAPLAELLLYCADRAQHLAEVVRPALEAGRVVLCDRFSDSTIAYQGYGRGLDLDVVRRLDALARADLEPTLTFLLECPPAAGLARAKARCGPADRFEQETLAFHEAVQRGFRALASASPDRYRLVDSTRPADEVGRDIEVATRDALAGRAAP